MHACLCIFIYSCFALHAQFDSTVACYLGCTIPALILLPMNSHLLPLPPAPICQGLHTRHSCIAPPRPMAVKA